MLARWRRSGTAGEAVSQNEGRRSTRPAPLIRCRVYTDMREGDLVVALVDCCPIDRDDSYFVAIKNVRAYSPLELLEMQAE